MSRRGRIAVALIAAMAAGAVAVGSESDALATKKPPPEKLEQGPAAVLPGDDPAARSPAIRAAVGPYVSVQVNVDALGQNVVGDAANEPSISVSPVNPANMVIAWRQFDSIVSNFRQAGWGYTFDKGRTWTFPGVLTPGTFRSDPVVDVDASGAFYFQSLKGDFTLDVFKSLDGGVTWGAPVPSFGGDKNWLVVDRTGGIGHGNVYGIWQRFYSSTGNGILTRSWDGGALFQTPTAVPRFPFFGTLAVDPDGTLFAVGGDGTSFQNLSRFAVARSRDIRESELPPTFRGMRVDLGGSMTFGDGPNPEGLLGQANVAADHSTGPTRGNVYVLASVLPDAGGDPLDVYFARSTDGGTSWSAPIRVNDDGLGNWQWLAAFAVAPNGRIDAIWFDTREGRVAHLSRLYYAYSWDAGSTWSPNVAVSPAFNSYVGWPRQRKLGDYSTLVADATGADVAYAATFTGGQDVYYLRLFPDCNGNGASDVDDVATGASLDCDLDRIPDECGAAPACAGAASLTGGSSFRGTSPTLEKRRPYPR